MEASTLSADKSRGQMVCIPLQLLNFNKVCASRRPVTQELVVLGHLSSGDSVTLQPTGSAGAERRGLGQPGLLVYRTMRTPSLIALSTLRYPRMEALKALLAGIHLGFFTKFQQSRSQGFSQPS